MEEPANRSLREQKKALRKEVVAQAKALPEPKRRQADAAICRLLRSLPEYRQAKTIFCFVGVDYEIDTKPFLAQVLEDGKRLTVPLCTGKGLMEARQITSLEDLQQGHYGLLEPREDSPAIQKEDIDFAVIPCVTANHRGMRMGHGGGYYDRMFEGEEELPAAVICREALTRQEIPEESFDHRFSITVTDQGVFRQSH